MSLNLSSLLKLSIAGAVILSVGACKPADKGQGALKSEGIAALNLSKSESTVFAKYFATDPCAVDEMEALGALAGLGLGESGANGVSYKSRNFSGGRVAYTDLTLREDGKDPVAFSASSVVFHCPKMGDEAPSFDRIDLTDIFMFDQDEEVEISAKTLNIANPTSDGARSIVQSLTQADPGDVEDTGFESISMTDAQMKSPDLNGTLAALSWGKTQDEDGRWSADLTLDRFELTHTDASGVQAMNMIFKGMSARNVSLSGAMNARRSMSPDGMMGTVFGKLNVFEKPYDELLIETMKVDAEGFSLDFGGIEGQTTEDADIITIRQTLKPTQMQMKPAMGNIADFKQTYDILKSLGFETMKMSGSSVTTLNSTDDSISVSDGLFVIDDAMRLNFEYQAEGLGAMKTKMNSVRAGESGADAMAAYDELKLKSFRMTMEDNSIVERGLKLAAEMTGQSETMIKRSLGMAVFAAAMAAENEVQAEVYSEATEAFADFVKKGGTLTIEANPPAPFPLAPLVTGKGEDVDPATLGFSASQAGGTE